MALPVAERRRLLAEPHRLAYAISNLCMPPSSNSSVPPVTSHVVVPDVIVALPLHEAIKEATAILTKAVLRVAVENVTSAMQSLTDNLGLSVRTIDPAEWCVPQGKSTGKKAGRKPGKEMKPRAEKEDDVTLRAKIIDALKKTQKPGKAAKLLGWEYELFYRRRIRLNVQPSDWDTSVAVPTAPVPGLLQSSLPPQQ